MTAPRNVTRRPMPEVQESAVSYVYAFGRSHARDRAARPPRVGAGRRSPGRRVARARGPGRARGVDAGPVVHTTMYGKECELTRTLTIKAYDKSNRNSQSHRT